MDGNVSEMQKARELAEARSIEENALKSENEVIGRNFELSERMRLQDLSQQEQEQVENVEAENLSLKEQYEREIVIQELQNQNRTQTIPATEREKWENSQKIIDFYNGTYWILIRKPKWIFDILDVLAGVGTIISLPLNVYIIIRFAKLKHLTGTHFSFFEYSCIITEFISVWDILPGMTLLGKRFEEQAEQVKQQAESNLNDLQIKYPHIQN